MTVASSGFVLGLRASYTGHYNKNSNSIDEVISIEWLSVNDVHILCEWHTIIQSECKSSTQDMCVT